MAIARDSTGRYTGTMPANLLSVNTYVVQLTVVEGGTFDDVLIQLDGTFSPTSTQFKYTIHEQDNGATAGVFRDRSHMISVIDVS
jgi:hypothetical protein